VSEVVVFGSLHFDIMVDAPEAPRPGATLVANGWSQKCGGKGGNQAVEAARHGVRTSMIGAVGDDAFGQRLLTNLRARGVNAKSVVTRPGISSGMSIAIVDPAGEYGALVVPGANATLGLEDAERARPVIEGARWLVLQNEVPDEANIAAARRARGHVLLNAAPARMPPTSLAGLVDLMVVNAADAEAMGTPPVTDLDSAAAAAEWLLAKVSAAIVTVGGAGVALAERAGGRLKLPGYEVQVASTQGASHALIGGLAARLAGGIALPDALRYANAAAAVFVATPLEQRAALTSNAVRSLLG
jgi:ribokinase